MTDTVTVPGMGKVDQRYLWGGVAAAAGVVGYAWYKRGQSGGGVEIIPNPESIPDTDRTPVVGDSSGSFNETAPGAIGTNAEWTQAATDHLILLGSWEAGVIGVALGKYLERQPLSATEVDIVMAARAATGDPPQGGPFAIIHALPATGAPAAAPANFRVTGNSVIADNTRSRVDLTWDDVTGAAGYQLHAYDETRGAPAGDQDSADNTHLYQPLWKHTRYRFTVAAKGADGKLGPESSLTVTTAG
jgi:hypothetical protein